jgi:hypothetical protein
VVSSKKIFQLKTRDVFPFAIEFIKGLFAAESGHRNIERICEKLPGNSYSKLQHFISESPWDAFAVMQKVANDSHELYKNFNSVGLIMNQQKKKKGSIQ